MIPIEEVKQLLEEAMPGAQVEVFDRTGTLDHFRIEVVYEGFREKPLLEQHRMIHTPLQGAKDAGRIHAVEIKTSVE